MQKRVYFKRLISLLVVIIFVLPFLVSCSTAAGQGEVEELIQEDQDAGGQQGADAQPTDSTEVDPAETAAYLACPYDGAMIEANIKRPLAVIIENSSDARPQSGYQHACVVFEMVAEGGITRTLAIFGHDSAEVVGPIRSARPYFVEIVKGYDALFSHWGGSDQAYQLIANLGIPDLDQMSKDIGNATYWRDGSRIAPHNGYSSTQKLYELAGKWKYSLEGGLSSFEFKDDANPSEFGAYSEVSLLFSSKMYNVTYRFDSSSNEYLRFVGDIPHIDRETGEQIAVKNVVALISDIANSGDGAGHMIIRTTGQGKAFVFRDGNLVEGTWERKSVNEPFKLLDKDGNPIPLNRGPVWVGVLASEQAVVY
ncbi:MAG: DUF3048 domain-containing protein [Actinobacteria bacterium]|nr:DUF3048 domain-containing protein [Actinomycetota bacterium]